MRSRHRRRARTREKAGEARQGRGEDMAEREGDDKGERGWSAGVDSGGEGGDGV